MDIFELRSPGTWLDNVPDGHQVLVLLSQLESHLADAAMGLALFQQAQGRLCAPSQRQPRMQAIQRVLEDRIPATLTPQQHSAARRETYEAADLQARREEWAAGRVPESYERRLPFIYAHTVVFALDNISKTLGVLAGMHGMPPGVAAARDAYCSALPDLIHVRDSAHHTEDRARGLAKNRQPLVLQPVNNGVIYAPNGMIGLSNLTNGRLGYTASDGDYREVEISAQSVAAAQAAIQQTLNTLSWHGTNSTAPR